MVFLLLFSKMKSTRHVPGKTKPTHKVYTTGHVCKHRHKRDQTSTEQSCLSACCLCSLFCCHGFTLPQTGIPRALPPTSVTASWQLTLYGPVTHAIVVVAEVSRLQYKQRLCWNLIRWLWFREAKCRL